MKRAWFAAKTRDGAFVFESAVELGELARCVIDSNPEHSRLAARRKLSATLDDDFEWLNFARCDRSCRRELLDVCDRNVAEKLQSEMQVVFAEPTGANFGHDGTQKINVFADSRT